MYRNELFRQTSVRQGVPRNGWSRRTATRRAELIAATGETRLRIVTPAIRRQLSIVMTILIAAITLGVVFYREPFRFWKYPLSDLGATVTEHGFSNIFSILFFDSGMILSGLIMFSISSRFAASKVEHRRIKRGLTFLCGIGFFVIIFPYNINDTIHMTGGGAVFGSLWGLTVLFLLELRHSVGWLRFWALQLPLQGTILPYAALFMAGLPIKQVFQKPAVVGLMLTLGLTLWMRTRVRRAAPLPANRSGIGSEARPFDDTPELR